MTAQEARALSESAKIPSEKVVADLVEKALLYIREAAMAGKNSVVDPIETTRTTVVAADAARDALSKLGYRIKQEKHKYFEDRTRWMIRW